MDQLLSAYGDSDDEQDDKVLANNQESAKLQDIKENSEKEHNNNLYGNIFNLFTRNIGQYNLISY